MCTCMKQLLDRQQFEVVVQVRWWYSYAWGCPRTWTPFCLVVVLLTDAMYMFCHGPLMALNSHPEVFTQSSHLTANPMVVCSSSPSHAFTGHVNNIPFLNSSQTRATSQWRLLLLMLPHPHPPVWHLLEQWQSRVTRCVLAGYDKWQDCRSRNAACREVIHCVARFYDQWQDCRSKNAACRDGVIHCVAQF